jgi:hypothetical protein
MQGFPYPPPAVDQ